MQSLMNDLGQYVAVPEDDKKNYTAAKKRSAKRKPQQRNIGGENLPILRQHSSALNKQAARKKPRRARKRAAFPQRVNRFAYARPRPLDPGKYWSKSGKGIGREIVREIKHSVDEVLRPAIGSYFLDMEADLDDLIQTEEDFTKTYARIQIEKIYSKVNDASRYMEAIMEVSSNFTAMIQRQVSGRYAAMHNE